MESGIKLSIWDTRVFNLVRNLGPYSHTTECFSPRFIVNFVFDHPRADPTDCNWITPKVVADLRAKAAWAYNKDFAARPTTIADAIERYAANNPHAIYYAEELDPLEVTILDFNTPEAYDKLAGFINGVFGVEDYSLEEVRLSRPVEADFDDPRKFKFALEDCFVNEAAWKFETKYPDAPPEATA
jgi:hypothetical protein